uniref:Uncharacterized protein n=1 Tax=Arundo donax TaxID=35708 RepID=A0A0A9FS31_ARUDO
MTTAMVSNVGYDTTVFAGGNKRFYFSICISLDSSIAWAH